MRTCVEFRRACPIECGTNYNQARSVDIIIFHMEYIMYTRLTHFISIITDGNAIDVQWLLWLMSSKLMGGFYDRKNERIFAVTVQIELM